MPETSWRCYKVHANDSFEAVPQLFDTAGSNHFCAVYFHHGVCSTFCQHNTIPGVNAQRKQTLPVELDARLLNQHLVFDPSRRGNEPCLALPRPL